MSSADAAQGGEKIDDSRIVRAVESEMLWDEGVSSHLIDVVVNDGVVTLSGSVGNLLEKYRAVRIAQTIRGVRSVVNNIDVMPVLRTEGEIRADAITALASDPATDSYEISVDVEKGTITLFGEVESFAEKRLAEDVVMGVKGVKEIKNNIAVAYSEERIDSEIKQDIVRRLEIDPFIQEDLITVEVDDGEVTLSGTVGSAAEKQQAFIKSWVAGVDAVDHAELEVEWWARDRMKRKKKQIDKSDAAIKEAIEDALLYDPRTYSFEIDISVDNGIVDLRGTVDNLSAKRSAHSDARNTIGVVRVNNFVKVRQEFPNDREVRQDVEDALVRDPITERYEINPVVRNNLVSLYGRVDSYFEKRHAEDVVARVDGVADVQNSLSVSEQWEFKSDNTIEEEVESELYWSAYVDENDVSVNVDDGVVILKGNVDSWVEFDAAIDKAFDGGARVVDAQMDVKNAPDFTPRYHYDQYFFHHPRAFYYY
jgi:osmotically-inducible protein OsmY